MIELGINVRVVKGHWTDPSAKVDCRENFLEVINALADRSLHVAVATHDYLLANEAIRRLTVSATSFELEQLISLPLVAKNIPYKRIVPVRIYIPFGYPYLPYSIRYVKERPEIWLWIIKDLITKRNGR